MSTDTRVCTTNDLFTLASEANQGGLLPLPTQLTDRLDPDGKHVLGMLMWGHNMERPEEKLWHRIRVMAKVNESNEPVEVIMEVFDESWVRLTPTAEYLARVAEESGG